MGNCSSCTQKPHHKVVDPNMRYLRQRKWSTDLQKSDRDGSDAGCCSSSSSSSSPSSLPASESEEQAVTSESDTTEPNIIITAVLPSEESIPLRVTQHMTVSQLKLKLSREEDIGVSKFDLIFAGDIMSERQPAMSYFSGDCENIIYLDLSVRELQCLVSNQPLPSQKDFIQSIRSHQEARVLNFIDRGVSLTEKDTSTGYTPLCAAVTANNLLVVEIILGFPNVLPSTECDWGSPLFIACDRGHLDCVKLLLSTGKVKVNGSFRMCGTPLYISCRNGFTSIVEELLKMNSVSVNKIGKTCIHHHTPLFAAVYNGHIGVVRLLVEHPKIKVNKLSGHAYDSSVPCQTAYEVAKNHPDICSIIESHGDFIAPPPYIPKHL